jgi:hypothetical protein
MFRAFQVAASIACAVGVCPHTKVAEVDDRKVGGRDELSQSPPLTSQMSSMIVAEGAGSP